MPRLAGDAHDLGGVDDASAEHLDILFGLGIEAVGRFLAEHPTRKTFLAAIHAADRVSQKRPCES